MGLLAAGLAGCLGSGSLDLELTLPTTEDLRPTGMTTITVLATSPEIDPIANRSVIAGNKFTAGELPVGDGIQINVLLHDVSNRLVGLGEAADLVDIKGDKETKLTIPVRRPFIYASSGSNVVTFDPTLDPRDMKFQGTLPGLTNPQVATSVGGDRLVVAGTGLLQVVETATHKVIGLPIMLGNAATIHDVTPVPGAYLVAVATSAGISIVDLDSSTVTHADVGPVDRVAVGPAGDGRMVAYGLVGRVAPPDTPLLPCSGSSAIVAVYVDNPTIVAAKPLAMGVSAIASAPTQAAVFATLPCANQVVRIEGDPTSEVATLTLTMVSELKNAAVIAVLGDRVWAAGTRPSQPMCTMGACTSAASTACPETSLNRVSYVAEGARMIVQSIPIGGGTAIILELPERRETMIDAEDMARQHAQVLHPLGTVPIDLVALPGGQYVSIVTKNSYYIESLYDPNLFTYLLPCMKTTTADWLLIDMASSSTAQRVRTSCMLTNIRTNAYFNMWECDEPPIGERSTQGDYVPLAVGALFGVR